MDRHAKGDKPVRGARRFPGQAIDARCRPGDQGNLPARFPVSPLGGPPMLQGDDIEKALRGRRIDGLRLKPFGPLARSGDSADVQYLDLMLDAGPPIRIWRGYEQGHVSLSVLDLAHPLGPDPDGVAPVVVDHHPDWRGVVGATIAAVELDAHWVPRPAPAGPPEPSGDPELDAWMFGPEDWAAWHFADDDPKEAYVLRALALELGDAGRLALRAVKRAEGPDLDPAAMWVMRVPGRAPGAAPPRGGP